MHELIALIQRLNSTQKTIDKLTALRDYFISADPRDAIWVVALFTGRRPKRPITSTQLKTWCKEWLQMPDWLFEECYQVVGDLAETLALLIPNPALLTDTLPPLHQLMQELTTLSRATDDAKRRFITSWWPKLDADGRWILHKLLMGNFRIGVSEQLIIQALAAAFGLDKYTVASRISGNWNPATTNLNQLLHASHHDLSRPYPFCLAYPLEDSPENHLDPQAWAAEWKWDGIRGQLIKRQNKIYLWSRGEELLTPIFPEIVDAAQVLPDNLVLDGEILPFHHDCPLPYQRLQTRMGRKKITPQILQQIPVVFMAYDLLEYEGIDWRSFPFIRRHQQLEACLQQAAHPQFKLSPLINFENWQTLSAERAKAREKGSEGIMLKKWNSPYHVGRHKGDWWKWKIDPFSLDAVMLYAQRGHGRRANLYTDYTFALRDGDQLIPFARAYSGLTDEEIREVDRFVKTHSREQFGPVRTVEPLLVFEIAFEGLAPSKRHRSGVAVRFPRILRWRKDKTPDQINTLQDLQQLLLQYGHRA
ncbi:MAG: ATP-dependent DNA ligase [Thermoflavifilum sp.]|nr:ATP-dependent DNA ligase [Thermoflavifilum sp.]